MIMIEKMIKVPLSIPYISNEDKKSIMDSLKSPNLTDGPKLRDFEAKFAKFVGSKYAIGVSNGTAALFLSLISSGIGKGDEVIIPDITFIATANAVIQTGAIPICVDVDSTLNISINSIKKNLTKKTKAIIPVHMAGFPCNMVEIMKIAKKNNLKIIEDCAHALGSHINKKHVGTFGNVGCFSFYPIKNLTTIEGGMIITNSMKIMKLSSSLRNHGLTKSLLQRDKNSKPWVYDIIEPGYNFRIDEIRSSLGISQLKRFKKTQTKRIEVAKYYHEKLKDLNGIEITNLEDCKKHAYHLYIIKIKKEFGMSRDKVHSELNKKGIRTTVHYRPIHQFSFFRKKGLKNKDFPNSMSAYKECLSLPLFPTISRAQQLYVIKQLKKLQN
jgi:perosamine synthetase